MNTATLKATPSTFNLPPLGAFLEDQGGYFAGVVMVNGSRRGVVVAGASGELKGIWGKRGEDIAAKHVSDGMANTLAMAAAGSDMAKQALALDINGHKDWHIPARDERELVYRTFKPGTQPNYCGFKDGENVSSVPVGQAYTKDSPSQTTVESFREGGPDALQSAWYWSSTQYSAHDAFFQDFEDGYQGLSLKDYEGLVRAVRSFLID